MRSWWGTALVWASESMLIEMLPELSLANVPSLHRVWFLYPFVDAFRAFVEIDTFSNDCREVNEYST